MAKNVRKESYPLPEYKNFLGYSPKRREYTGMKWVSTDYLSISYGEPFEISGRDRTFTFRPPVFSKVDTSLDDILFPGVGDVPPISQQLYFHVFCTILNIIREQSLRKKENPNSFSLTDLICRLQKDAPDMKKRNKSVRKYVHRIVQMLSTTICESITQYGDSANPQRFSGGNVLTIRYNGNLDETGGIKGEHEVYYTVMEINGNIQEERDLFLLQRIGANYPISYALEAKNQMEQLNWTSWVQQIVDTALDFGVVSAKSGCEIKVSMLYQVANVANGPASYKQRIRDKLIDFLYGTYGDQIAEIVPIKNGREVVSYTIKLNYDD